MNDYDDYIEYKIVTGDNQFEDSGSSNSGGWIVLVVVIFIILWIIAELFT